MTEPKNMLIHHTIFHYELFFVVYLLVWVRDPQLCCRWQAYMHCITAWMTTWPLSVERFDTASHVNFFYLNILFCHEYSIICIDQKHLAQTCWSITLADSLTFLRRFVFSGKAHNLQTWKYGVGMTSPLEKNMIFYRWNICFFVNVAWKFCENLNIFHGDIKENVSGCLFKHRVKKGKGVNLYSTSRVHTSNALFVDTGWCSGQARQRQSAVPWSSPSVTHINELLLI